MEPLHSECAGSSFDSFQQGISLSGDTIDLLESPEDYFETIIKNIRRAKSDIVLCALYIGTERQEIRLIEELRSALLRDTDLEVRLCFDFCRTTRKGDTSVKRLHEALSAFGERTHVCLYKMPTLSSVPYKYLPSPLNEILGVYHCKFCVFDDTVIISGANLSKTYFTDRQDRYLQVHYCKELARYLHSFYRIVQRSSYILNNRTGRLVSPMQTNVNGIRDDLRTLSGRAITARDLSLATCNETTLVPLIQHSSVGVINEMEETLGLLTHSYWKDIILSSPYCSYTPAIVSALRHASHNGASICILTSSREAHGFHGATGFKALIPELHDISLAHLMHSLRDLPNVQTMVYNRPGWSFHAKGMWCFPQDKNSPVVSYVGSSNGGYRSWARDFELGFFVSSSNRKLQNSLISELNFVKSHCTSITSEQEIAGNIKMFRAKNFLHRFLKTYL